MKNRRFDQRLGFALRGISLAWNTESSFRTQIVLGGATTLLLIFLRPPLLWCALVLLCIGGVLSAEMMNTAFESFVDHLHPDLHPMVARAKDCAAGAVLMMSLTSVGVLIFLLCEKFHFL